MEEHLFARTMKTQNLRRTWHILRRDIQKSKRFLEIVALLDSQGTIEFEIKRRGLDVRKTLWGPQTYKPTLFIGDIVEINRGPGYFQQQGVVIDMDPAVDYLYLVRWLTEEGECEYYCSTADDGELRIPVNPHID